LAGTQEIAAGTIADYQSIYIAAGATLKIKGTNQITVLGSLGSVVIDGSIITEITSPGTSSAEITTPLGETLNYTQTRVLGGDGGRGTRDGNWHGGTLPQPSGIDDSMTSPHA